MSHVQSDPVTSVADLAAMAADNLANEVEQATADVVVLLFVRLQSGEYMQPATVQCSWQDWLIKNVVPGPPPAERQRREAEASDRATEQ
jgi:hypothetical protein